MRRYEPDQIEPKWVERWAAEGLYAAVDEDDGRPRFYALDMFPYPSGDLHMGHIEAFSGGDAIARFRWMQGHNVLHPIGWDAFGLNAENAAIKRGADPREWTYANIDQQRRSFKRMGFSFDWTRQLNTCDPDYYRWTQWLFLQFFERGLAYRKLAPVNWCPTDQTVLANEQVIGGRCERCDTPVVRKDLTQWFFKITDYAQRLLDDMEGLDWTDRVLNMQRNWIGRSEGAEVEFEIEETGDRVTVFTTRPDTLWGVTFFVFAPEHPLVSELARAGGGIASDAAKEMLDRLQATPLTSREQAESREGVRLGVHAVNPVNGERVPCFVAPYVLMEYGTGAVMGVPGHDQRDFEFAREQGLEVRVVIQPAGDQLFDGSVMDAAYSGDGVMANSGSFDGTPTSESVERVTSWLGEQGLGRHAVSFRLRDWLISRQRYWGCPIPIVHCPSCGEVPVPEDELPVLLPEDVDFSPQGESPLAKNEEFVNTTCPKCGGRARRETDTIDTFVDSSWYFLRYCRLEPDRAFDAEAVQRWMPANQYTGGIEHAILHLLYSRFFTKVLYDLGLVPFEEPFRRLLNQGSVIYAGAAMSKTRGNIVEPMPLVERQGADTVRVTMLFAGPFEDDVDWAYVSTDGVHRWLRRVWHAVHAVAGGEGEDGEALRRITHRTIKAVTDLYERFRFNRVVSSLMELTNAIEPAVKRGEPARDACVALLQLLAPIGPFIAEELWRETLGIPTSVHSSRWPAFDPELAREERVTLVVQIDGKVRDRIEVEPDVTGEQIEQIALASPRVQRALDGRTIERVIAKPPRLVNLVSAPG